MKNPLKFLSLCLTLAMVAAPVVKAQSDDAAKPARERGPGGGRGPTLEMLAEQLELTAEQKEKIAPIWKHQAEQMQAIRKDDSLSREQKMEKTKAAREETHKAIEALLTPEQAKKFSEMRPNGPRAGGGERPKGHKKGEKSDK